MTSNLSNYDMVLKFIQETNSGPAFDEFDQVWLDLVGPNKNKIDIHEFKRLVKRYCRKNHQLSESPQFCKNVWQSSFEIDDVTNETLDYDDVKEWFGIRYIQLFGHSNWLFERIVLWKGDLKKGVGHQLLECAEKDIKHEALYLRQMLESKLSTKLSYQARDPKYTSTIYDILDITCNKKKSFHTCMNPMWKTERSVKIQEKLEAEVDQKCSKITFFPPFKNFTMVDDSYFQVNDIKIFINENDRTELISWLRSQSNKVCNPPIEINEETQEAQIGADTFPLKVKQWLPYGDCFFS